MNHHLKGAPAGVLCLAVTLCLFCLRVPADTVTTYAGNGADAELNEGADKGYDNGNGTATSMNARFSNSDRYDLIALRFDLTGYNPGDTANVTLRLTNFRINTAGRILHLYGVTAGAVGKDANGVIRGYTAENWNEADILFSTMPGLNWDGVPTTLSLDLSNLTDLGTLTQTTIAEGTVQVFSGAALTAFVQGHPTNKISFLVLQDTINTSQARFATKEATQLATTGLFTGPPGTFAPALTFDLPPPAPPGITGVTNQTGYIGYDTTIANTVSGHPAPVLQWFDNGTNLPGATGYSLVLSNVQAALSGHVYSLVASNSLGLATNRTTLIVVPGPPPIVVTPPSIPNQNFYVTNYGALADGVKDNTTNIQNTILAASAAGGGNVIFTPGTFLSGPFVLANSINLMVTNGATLKMLPYNLATNYAASGTYFIYAATLHDLEISGTGTIDGQGSAWWTAFNNSPSSSPIARPYMIYFNSSLQRVLLQDVKIQNAPAQQVVFKGNGSNVAIQRVKITASSSSPNTDGIDLVGTNCIVQDCTINTGDDNIALGSSGGLTAWMLITNCSFGVGHGLSIGSHTERSVSNITVINCTFSGTDNGIRMKSDNDRGGLTQNINYYNIGMTNVGFPIAIFSYYNNFGTYGITPQVADGQPPQSLTTTMPVWRDITISNLTATTQSGYPAGIIWGRSEMCVTNVTIRNSHISGHDTFQVYNAQGIQFVDSAITVPSGTATYTLFNAGAIVSNSTPVATPVTFDGLTADFGSNSLALFNAAASLLGTNVLGGSPNVTLGGGGTLTVGNDLVAAAPAVFNFILGTNTAQVSSANLNLSGTVNVCAGPGFGAGTYTLFNYTGSFSSNNLALGTVPGGYSCAFDTGVSGKLRLQVQMVAPPPPLNLAAAPTNSIVRLSWSPTPTATSYNVKRSTTNGGSYLPLAPGVTATNYPDSAVTNGVTYYYVVSAVNNIGEGSNSAPVSAMPSPSLTPVKLVPQNVGGQLLLAWPADHIGWHLQIQTNANNVGVGTNWVNVAGSDATNQVLIPYSPANGNVFLRMAYP